MKYRTILSLALVIWSMLFMTNCGTSTKVTNTNEASVGQQLTELDMAYRQGIITEREYARLKKALIKRND